MSGSFAEAVFLIRKEIEADLIPMTEIIDSEFVEPGNCFPSYHAMPEVEKVEVGGIITREKQGYPSVATRKALGVDQVRGGFTPVIPA